MKTMRTTILGFLAAMLMVFALPSSAAPEKIFSLNMTPTNVAAGAGVSLTATLRNETPSGNSSINSAVILGLHDHRRRHATERKRCHRGRGRVGVGLEHVALEARQDVCAGADGYRHGGKRELLYAGFEHLGRTELDWIVFQR